MKNRAAPVKIERGTRLIIGKNSVREVLRWAPERILHFFSTKEPTAMLDDGNAANFTWKKLEYDELSDLAGSDSHQGLSVVVRERNRASFKEILKELVIKEKCRVVLLSSVQDPHHLGAIFRAAEVFGIDLIVYSAQHSTGITPAVTKVAVGATELVPHCEVSNINDALRKLKEAGFWVVAAEPGNDQQDLAKFDFPRQTAIVFGAEGEGIPKLTLELSDFRVAISQVGKIDSLSLSQAAAIFLYEAQREK